MWRRCNLEAPAGSLDQEIRAAAIVRNMSSRLGLDGRHRYIRLTLKVLDYHSE